MEQIKCPHCSEIVSTADTCSQCHNILPLSSKNFFTLFDLNPGFDIDIEDINQKLINKLRFWHPDNFINSNELVKSIATSNAALINHAYKQLSSSLNLASYLLSLEGIDTSLLTDENHKLSNEFLLEAMEWREELEEIITVEECNIFKSQLIKSQQKELKKLGTAFNKRDIKAVTHMYVELKFIDRFIGEIEKKLEKIDGIL